MEGERKLVTVLFADMAGFTSLSEKLEPEEVHQIMEGCLRILMDEIHKYEGTINQFTGRRGYGPWALNTIFVLKADDTIFLPVSPGWCYTPYRNKHLF